MLCSHGNRVRPPLAILLGVWVEMRRTQEIGLCRLPCGRVVTDFPRIRSQNRQSSTFPGWLPAALKSGSTEETARSAAELRGHRKRSSRQYSRPRNCTTNPAVPHCDASMAAAPRWRPQGPPSLHTRAPLLQGWRCSIARPLRLRGRLTQKKIGNAGFYRYERKTVRRAREAIAAHASPTTAGLRSPQWLSMTAIATRPDAYSGCSTQCGESGLKASAWCLD